MRLHVYIAGALMLLGLGVALDIASAAAAETSSTATGVSSLMNPAVSVNALFLGETSADVGGADANRIAIQEVEMQLTSVVDPFWTADLVLGWHEEEAHEDEEVHGAPHFVTDIEIATLRSTAMPAGLGLTLGKFYLPFGKHAVLHTHQFPFVRAPITVRSFLGDHGLSDVGAALDATVPLPWWSEITIYGVDGRSEVFNGEHRDLAFGGRWCHLWDVSDSGTFELGGSYLTGPAKSGGGYDRVELAGIDLTLKHDSGFNTGGSSTALTCEVFLPDFDRENYDAYGYNLFARSRVHQDWWLSVGIGIVESTVMFSPTVDGKDAEHEEITLRDSYEYKINIAYAPSDFSAVRAEAAWISFDTGLDDDLRFSLQCNFTIGSHPAHLY